MDTHHIKHAILFLALAVTLAIPFLLRPKGEAAPRDARTLVIISPHNEAVRREFETAFRRWHARQFGQAVTIDWRNIGGTSEIVRYLDSEYESAQRVSRPGIGIDLLFGGGQYDHARQAAKGHTEPCGLRIRHPEWLTDTIIPRQFSGEQFYDPEDRWYGCCLTSFGICYNDDVLRACGIDRAPRQWIDLTDFRYFRQVALADPTKSGSIAKAFEMLIQEQMMTELSVRHQAPSEASGEALAAGWRRALSVVRQIAANARYFTDSAGKVPTDVSLGDAAAGMCIDYYGRFESETIAQKEGSTRMHYLTPINGSSLSVDPISMLRGAPHRELAERFIDFCLSVEGQQVWDYRVGEPGGPVRYALRRLPIRRDLYRPEHLQHMSDSEAMPYEKSGQFTYHPEWTGSLFNVMRVLIRAMCLDTHAELAAAWEAIHRAGGPAACPDAMAALTVLPASAEYTEAQGTTSRRIGNKLEEVRLAREWVVFFRAQYQKAKLLADSQSNIKPRN
ncbi:MAG: ABC transporter substrate-binding protein [Verrucomicrobia bacterium]|nr:ABC transporter substrate-binding protein [Verrucomicrobiota bacterium]MBU4246978.1 ABC transporter substrate-binding protein [Verrucomicrobiota bacterium]MBU4290514.1 ABC transporter substrate-binding protein [Verrucomicrobiota bacterium]MBU4427795.1 ABC transporter substrate-binding protein [Verrucomicrobiota bacterium]MCG2681295.1 ABC transporter substrate-binding protein [Kiritimatiellia bacterium]